MASFEERTRGNGSMDGWDELAGSGGYVIRDEGDIRKYYTQIPNMIIDMELSPSAFKLYVYLKRVAGESGKCWKSTRRLASDCRMSKPTVIKAKRELEEKELVSVIERTHPNNGYSYHEIRIVDVWRKNLDIFVEMYGDPGKQTLPAPVKKLVPKNNPYKNNNTK